MAFSIEAVIAIPLCLSVFAHSTALAAPVASGVKSTAVMAAYAASKTTHSGYTCRHYTLEKKDAKIPMAETNPQLVVETMSLAHDLIATIRGAMHPIGEPEP